ncbi:MAG: hypothetical protein EXR70_22780 [Deltaproteobacteria bacterium]|nr:hypothetical protein [Deltaproteobacteria bacterium]
MLRERAKVKRICQRLATTLPALGLFVLSACTSPLWWHEPNRGFIYRGWGANIVDQATVIRECAAPYPVLGCVKPETMTVFAVNNPYVLRHECQHIENIMSGNGSAEKLKDAFYAIFAINDLLTAATSLLPAPNDCGDGTMAEWQDGKIKTVHASYDNLQVLPSMEQWQKQNPQPLK